MKTCRSTSLTLLLLLLLLLCCMTMAKGQKGGRRCKKRGNRDQLKLSERILDKLTSLDKRFTSFDERLTRLEDRITSLDQGLVSVDHRLTSLEQKMAASDARCSSPEPDRVTGGHSVQTSPSPFLTPGSFAFRKVSRERTAEGYSVRIEYQGSEEPFVNLLSGGLSYKRLEGHHRVDHENRTVEIWLTGTEWRLSVTFELKSKTYSLVLNVAAETPTETEVVTPQMVFLSGNDVVFERGTDAEVSILFVRDNGDGFEDTSDLSWTGHTASEGKENTIYFYTVSQPLGPSIEVTSDVTSADRKERTLEIRFNTASVEKAAIFTVGLDFDLKCSGQCLVNTVRVGGFLNLYPADETGPVPPGFIGFIEYCRYDQLVEHDVFWECLDANTSSVETTTYCGLGGEKGRRCEMYCGVLADPKAASFDLKMVKVGRVEGETTPVDFKTFPGLGIKEYASLYIANPSFSDAGQYRCIARTESRQAEMTQTLVVVTRFAKVVRGRSHAKKLENRTLEARCVAEGVPSPNITFISHKWRLSGKSEYVTLTQLNASTVQADLRITDPAFTSNMYYLDCEASNGGPHMYDQQNIHIVDFWA